MTSLQVRPEATATITVTEPVVVVPGYDVTRPAVTVYASNFTSSLDGWTETVGTPTFSGTLDWLSNGSSSGLVQHTRTGLSVGRTYTLTARFATNNMTPGNIRLGVTGKTYATVTPPGDSPRCVRRAVCWCQPALSTGSLRA